MSEGAEVRKRDREEEDGDATLIREEEELSKGKKSAKRDVDLKTGEDDRSVLANSEEDVIATGGQEPNAKTSSEDVEEDTVEHAKDEADSQEDIKANADAQSRLVNKVGVGANDTKPKLETGENSQEVSNSTNKDAEETSKNPLNHSSNDFSNKSNKILEAPKDATKVSNEQKSEHDGGEHAKSAVPKNAEDSTSGEASKSDESQPSAEKTAKIFGTGTSFGSKTLDSFTEKKDESDDVTKNGSATSGLASSGSGTKFGSSAIFGSGTSFGTRSLSNWASASGSSDQSGSTSIFGSGSTSSLAKPSVNIFDTVSNDKEEGAEDVKEDKNEEDASVNEDLYVKVAAPLEQRSVETGEEQEDSVFSCRVRLYALDLTNAAVGWKERGTGTLHVNKMRDGSRSRLVMRADAVLRVILNLPLVQNMEVAQGMKSSLASDKFVRITGFEDKKPHQYALKAANPELAQELFNHINELVVTS